MKKEVFEVNKLYGNTVIETLKNMVFIDNKYQTVTISNKRRFIGNYIDCKLEAINIPLSIIEITYIDRLIRKNYRKIQINRLEVNVWDKDLNIWFGSYSTVMPIKIFQKIVKYLNESEEKTNA